MQTLYPRLVKCAEAGALATETRLETEYLGGIVEILPNPILGRVVQTNLVRLNDLKYDERETEFADAIRKTLAGTRSLRLDSLVEGDRPHRPGGYGLDRRGRRLVGRADGRVHDGLLGAGHARHTRGRRSRPAERPSAARG